MKKSKLLPEWDLTRGYRDGMRSHSRRRQTHRILLGKSLLWHKSQNETARGANKGGPMGQFERTAKTWDLLCREQLGMSRPTADRAIRRFEKACDLAKAEDFAKSFPAATDLLFRPLGQLSEAEIDELAEVVEHLVDRMTAADLRIELGIEIEDDPQDEQEAESSSGDFQEDLEQEALIFFASLPRKIAAMKKAIAPFRDYGKYQIFLHKLPLDDGRDGMPSLLGIKEGLEAIMKDGFSDVISDIQEAIESKMHGKPAKPGQNSLTRRRR